MSPQEQERYEYFQQFYTISIVDYDLLISKLSKKSFKKGELLVVPGQTQREIYFVSSGVQMAYLNDDDKTHVVAFTYFPNLCAIPESFAFQVPASYHLTCLTDSELECLRFTDLIILFDQSQAIERLFRRMTEALLAGMINRHLELLSTTITERYKNFCARSGHLLHVVPHKYIASYLGIDASNFSKLYNRVRF